MLTVSDKASRGEREDLGGPLVCRLLEAAGVRVSQTQLLPDDRAQIEEWLREAADVAQVDLVVTTGGTGFSLRDVTPEATMAVADRLVPGIAELIRLEGLKHTPRAMLSRACCVLRDKTVILNLPGSPKAIEEGLVPTLPVLLHGMETLHEPGQDCARK